MSQYGGYGNPYYGGYYYPYDNQTTYYCYGHPDYVTGHAEGSGSSFHNFEDNLPPHGYPRIYPEYQSLLEDDHFDLRLDLRMSKRIGKDEVVRKDNEIRRLNNTAWLMRRIPQSSYMQDHARSDDDHRNFLFQRMNTRSQQQHFPLAATASKAREGSLKDFGQSPHSQIQIFKGKERHYQDLKKKQAPLQGYEEIETDEDKILNPEIPATSPRRSDLRYEGLLKQHPLRDFDTVGELKQWAQDWSWSQGLRCHFSKARSAERKSSIRRRTGCSTRTNLWSLCPTGMQRTHNHEPAPAISAEMIHNQTAVGSPPKQILSTLKKPKKTSIHQRNTLEHLYYKSIRSNYLYDLRSIATAQLLTCSLNTPKTNVFRYPLIHIVGMTATSQVFSIAFCFQRQLKTTFLNSQKHYLHLAYQKEIMARCKKAFETEEKWVKFFTLWMRFSRECHRRAYTKKNQEVDDYLLLTWMPHMELFTIQGLKVHTQGLNLFQQNSSGNFLQVFQNISLSMEGQKTEVVTRLSIEKTKVLNNISPVFIHLHKKISQFVLLKLQQQHDIMTQGNQEPCSGKFSPLKLSDVHHQWHLIVLSAMEKKTEDLNTEELAEQEFENLDPSSSSCQLEEGENLLETSKRCAMGTTGLNLQVLQPAMQFPGATKTSTQRDMSGFEVEDAIAAHKKNWEEHGRQKAKKAPLPSVPIVNPRTSKSNNLRTRSKNLPSPIPNSPFHTRGNSSTRSSSFDGKNKDSPSKPLQEQKDLYKIPYLTDDLIASTSIKPGVREEEQDQKSKFGVERTSVRSLYQSPIVRASLSDKEDISSLEDLRKEQEKASKSLKKEAEDDLFDLVSRKTSFQEEHPKISPTTYETVTQGSSIKPRTEHEELMRDIPQPLQRFIE
ncbi:hypothetical protein PPACK8108_LOCUS24949 [Phakopsora pachyrhizi]|uniref:Uncharacterized protein n=1 Tax=Phakopsora pachyrhizi TaxID=170000 RepID=A0AAV0BR02_PHAPC|nr:hypothetical protein PPACK8108_LOCUS24949 [Phakopsora pachyrhizi]